MGGLSIPATIKNERNSTIKWGRQMRKIYLLMPLFLFGCSATPEVKPEKTGVISIQDGWEYVSGEKQKNPDYADRSLEDRYPCELGDASCNMDYQPTMFVSPHFPAKALDNHIEGNCIVKFEVTVEGGVEYPEIVSCEPVGVFENVTITSILRAKFLPRVEAGKAVRVKEAKVKFNYRIKPD